MLAYYSPVFCISSEQTQQAPQSVQRNIIYANHSHKGFDVTLCTPANKPLEFGERHAAQPLAWQHSLILLGSHGRLQGIKATNHQGFFFFLLLPKCRLTIFHFAEGALLLLGSLTLCGTTWALSRERTDPALSWYPDEILNLNVLWPLWGNIEPTE